jgi:hypothetical protein
MWALGSKGGAQVHYWMPCWIKGRERGQRMKAGMGYRPADGGAVRGGDFVVQDAQTYLGRVTKVRHGAGKRGACLSLLGLLPGPKQNVE